LIKRDEDKRKKRIEAPEGKRGRDELRKMGWEVRKYIL
jgi:hypothetical protein